VAKKRLTAEQKRLAEGWREIAVLKESLAVLEQIAEAN